MIGDSAQPEQKDGMRIMPVNYAAVKSDLENISARMAQLRGSL